MDLVNNTIQSLEELNRRNSLQVFDRMFQNDPSSGVLLDGYVDVFWRKMDDDTANDFKNLENNLRDNMVVCISLGKTYMHYGDYTCSHFTNEKLSEHLFRILKRKNGDSLNEVPAFMRQTLCSMYLDLQAMQMLCEMQERYERLQCKFIHDTLRQLSECTGGQVYFMRTANNYLLPPDCYRNKVFMLKGITETQNMLQAVISANEDPGYVPANRALIEMFNEINEFGKSCFVKTDKGLVALYTLGVQNGTIPFVDVVDLKFTYDLENLGTASVSRYVTCLETLLFLAEFCDRKIDKEDVMAVMSLPAAKNYSLPFIISRILHNTK